MPADLTKFALNFDKEVYEWLMNCQDANRSDLFWGKGKIHQLLDTYGIVKKVSEKVNLKASDFKDEIKQLNEMLQFEAELLEKSIRDQIRIIMQANELLSDLKNIENIIMGGKVILESIA